MDRSLVCDPATQGFFSKPVARAACPLGHADTGCNSGSGRIDPASSLVSRYVWPDQPGVTGLGRLATYAPADGLAGDLWAAVAALCAENASACESQCRAVFAPHVRTFRYLRQYAGRADFRD